MMKRYIVENEIETKLCESDDELLSLLKVYRGDNLNVKVFTVTQTDHNKIINMFGGRLNEYEYIESYFDLNLD